MHYTINLQQKMLSGLFQIYLLLQNLKYYMLEHSLNIVNLKQTYSFQVRKHWQHSFFAWYCQLRSKTVLGFNPTYNTYLHSYSHFVNNNSTFYAHESFFFVSCSSKFANNFSHLFCGHFSSQVRSYYPTKHCSKTWRMYERLRTYCVEFFPLVRHKNL